jgi:hypothetical protein
VVRTTIFARSLVVRLAAHGKSMYMRGIWADYPQRRFNSSVIAEDVDESSLKGNFLRWRGRWPPFLGVVRTTNFARRLVVRLAAHEKSMYMQGILADYPQRRMGTPAVVDAVAWPARHPQGKK